MTNELAINYLLALINLDQLQLDYLLYTTINFNMVWFNDLFFL